MKAKLREEYRKTWETFSQKMTRVQEMPPSADRVIREAAMRDAELALAAHKQARDLLAAALAPEKLQMPMSLMCPAVRAKQAQAAAA